MQLFTTTFQTQTPKNKFLSQLKNPCGLYTVLYEDNVIIVRPTHDNFLNEKTIRVGWGFKDLFNLKNTELKVMKSVHEILRAETLVLKGELTPKSVGIFQDLKYFVVGFKLNDFEIIEINGDKERFDLEFGKVYEFTEHTRIVIDRKVDFRYHLSDRLEKFEEVLSSSLFHRDIFRKYTLKALSVICIQEMDGMHTDEILSLFCSLNRVNFLEYSHSKCDRSSAIFFGQIKQLSPCVAIIRGSAKINDDFWDSIETFKKDQDLTEAAHGSVVILIAQSKEKTDQIKQKNLVDLFHTVESLSLTEIEHVIGVLLSKTPNNILYNQLKDICKAFTGHTIDQIEKFFIQIIQKKIYRISQRKNPSSCTGLVQNKDLTDVELKEIHLSNDLKSLSIEPDGKNARSSVRNSDSFIKKQPDAASQNVGSKDLCIQEMSQNIFCTSLKVTEKQSSKVCSAPQVDNVDTTLNATYCEVQSDAVPNLPVSGISQHSKDFRLSSPEKKATCSVDIDPQNLSSQARSTLSENLLEKRHSVVSNAQISSVTQSQHHFENMSIEAADFDEVTKKYLRNAKNAVVKRSKCTFKDIGGYDDIKQIITESIIWPIKYKNTFEAYNIIPEKGIIFHGPPGCSKTLFAKAISNEAGMNFISIKGPEIENMYFGETERCIREIFQKARESKPCIIFIDEIDCITAKRKEDAHQHNIKVLSSFLTELDGLEEISGVIVLGATNRLDIIDPAFLRPGRINKKIYVGLPDQNARKCIFNLKLHKSPGFENIDIDELAVVTEGFSGADITCVCNDSAMELCKKSITDRSNASLTQDIIKRQISDFLKTKNIQRFT